MKNYRLTPTWLLMSLFAALLLIVSACNKDKDEEPDNLVKFENIKATGAQETPPNNSTATATLNATYNKDTKILTYTIVYTGVNATNMHFHKAPIGTAGGIVVPIGSAPYASPINGTTPALTTEQETDLLAGLWYLNIHSAQFPAGEIRGQLVQQ